MPNKPKPTPTPARKQATKKTQTLRNETPEDKAFRKLMEKYNYDVTKIPGFKMGKGTQ